MTWKIEIQQTINKMKGACFGKKIDDSLNIDLKEVYMCLCVLSKGVG